MIVELRKLLLIGFMTLSLLLFWASANAIVLKIATLSPEGAAWMVTMRDAANTIKQRTNGRVDFKFYSGGVMGSDESVLRKIKIGQLHGGAVTGGSLLGIYPDLSVYSLPFLFRSLEEADVVRKELDPVLIQGLEDKGFVTFGLAEGGFAYFMSNSKLQTTEDLKHQKIWIVTGDRISEAVFESASIAPIPLPLSDVMTGLQTGLINTVMTSPLGAISLQWHSRVKYLTDTPVAYFFGMLTVDKKVFDKIDAADQAVIREVMADAFAGINAQNRLDNQAAREALKNQGIEFVSISPEMLENWRQATSNATQKLVAEHLVNPDFYKKIEDILTAYRAGK
jgi:TRAP-type C4-dicarboxylate transport system substrate-binding protein